MDLNYPEKHSSGFIPETFGLMMDVVCASDTKYETLKKQAEEGKKAVRWSGKGKNMSPLGSYEPSRFDDTFVGNFRRAGIYKSIPTRTVPAYEYWLDEQGCTLAALMYNIEDEWEDRLGPYYFETFRAYNSEELSAFVCFHNESGGKKTMNYIYGYRYTGKKLTEQIEMHYIGGEIKEIQSMLFCYDADDTLKSVEEYILYSPSFYLNPLVRILEGNMGPVLPTLTYRNVVYQILHKSIT